jgi:hypothetical protein
MAQGCFPGVPRFQGSNYFLSFFPSRVPYLCTAARGKKLRRGTRKAKQRYHRLLASAVAEARPFLSLPPPPHHHHHFPLPPRFSRALCTHRPPPTPKNALSEAREHLISATPLRGRAAARRGSSTASLHPTLFTAFTVITCVSFFFHSASPQNEHQPFTRVASDCPTQFSGTRIGARACRRKSCASSVQAKIEDRNRTRR